MFAHYTYLLRSGVTGAKPAQEGRWSSRSNSSSWHLTGLPGASPAATSAPSDSATALATPGAETSFLRGAVTIFLLSSSTILFSHGHYVNCATWAGSALPQALARHSNQKWKIRRSYSFGDLRGTAVPEGRLADSERMGSLKHCGLGHPRATGRRRYWRILSRKQPKSSKTNKITSHANINTQWS